MKMVNYYQKLTIFAKRSILAVWQGSASLWMLKDT